MELQIKKGSVKDDWKEGVLSLLKGHVRIITSFDEGIAIRFEIQGDTDKVIDILTKEGFEVRVIQ